jgi:hypothetical protein
MATLSMMERMGPICGGPDEGERIREEVRALLQRGEPVCLDFTGVRFVLSPFLMQVIGPRYGEFAKDFLATHLTWSGLSDLGDSAAKRVRDKAIFFYSQTPEIQARLIEAALHPVEHLDR